MMRPTWPRLSNSLAGMPEGWDTPGLRNIPELRPHPR